MMIMVRHMNAELAFACGRFASKERNKDVPLLIFSSPAFCVFPVKVLGILE